MKVMKRIKRINILFRQRVLWGKEEIWVMEGDSSWAPIILEVFDFWSWVEVTRCSLYCSAYLLVCFKYFIISYLKCSARNMFLEEEWPWHLCCHCPALEKISCSWLSFPLTLIPPQNHSYHSTYVVTTNWSELAWEKNCFCYFFF